MKVVAAYKWAANPQDASVDDAGRVDWGRAQAALSEYDPVAFEVGSALTKAAGGELVALTVGGPEAATALAKKGVLSRGPDQLALVTGDEFAHLDTTSTAVALADAIRHIGGVDLVLTGASSIDVSAGLVPAVLAGLLGWPCILDAHAVSATDAGLSVERAAAGGTETVAVPLPAVVAMAADAATPRIPGMKDILAAGKKPAQAVEVAAPEPRPSLVSASKPALKQRRRQQIAGADPAAAAAELVAALRAAGALEGIGL